MEEMKESIEQPQEEVAQEQPQIDLSKQFAELQQRERKLTLSEKKMKESMEAEKAKWSESLKSNPVQYLQEQGIDIAQVVNAYLDIPQEEQKAPEQQSFEMPEEYKKQLDELAAYKQQEEMKRFEKEIFGAIEDKAEDFELLLNSAIGKDSYKQAISAYVQEYGELPNYEDIARELETQLEKQAEQFAQLNKFKKLFQTEKPAPQQKVKEQPAKTLRNNMASSSSAVSEKKQFTARFGSDYVDDLLKRHNAL